MHRLLLAALSLPLTGCDLPAHAGPDDGGDVELADGEGGGSGGLAECAPVMALSCGATWSADTTDVNDGATSVLDTYPDVVGQYPGPEIVYAFVADGDTEVTVDLVNPDPMAVDHDLLLLEDQGGLCSPDGAVARGFHDLSWSASAGSVYYVVVDGFGGDAGPFEATLSCSGPVLSPSADEPVCPTFDSTDQESAPLQTAGEGLPDGALSLSWTRPTAYTSWVDFAGVPGESATHEGIDWIHDDASVPVVDVVAAADGEVVYVRRGCQESTRLGHNDSMRECGGGWGNHVVIHHGSGIYTRYAHLDNADVAVIAGDVVTEGERIAGMGNSGRSETRHLHFELGSRAAGLDSCAPAQSFELVYAPGLLGL